MAQFDELISVPPVDLLCLAFLKGQGKDGDDAAGETAGTPADGESAAETNSGSVAAFFSMFPNGQVNA